MKNKDIHDRRAEKGRQTGPYTNPDLDTAFNCLNRMRKRTTKLLPGDILGDSFEHALDSADGVEIFTVWEKGDEEEHRVIVKNLKDNWQQDTKYLNAPNGVGFETGNTITWKRLGIRWLIVWQDFNYSSYFKGEMFRASHLLSWKNEHGEIIRQWASIRGPVEIKAKYDNVSGNYLGGRQNDTLDVWIGYNNKEDVDSLARFDKIKVGTRTWKIQVRDDISNPNVLRMSCIENFNNDYTDDVINAIPDGQIAFPEDIEEPKENIVIVGANTIKEGFSQTFTARQESNLVEGTFEVYVNGELKRSEIGSSITLRGTKLGDQMELRFIQDGEVKAHVRIPVVSIFG